MIFSEKVRFSLIKEEVIVSPQDAPEMVQKII